MFLDAHAHLDRFGDSLESALQEIVEYRICTISVSMDPSSYRTSRDLSSRCNRVIPAFGIHPWNAHLYACRLLEFSEFVSESPLIGEIGLDYHFVKDSSQYADQRKVFEFFLEAARTQGKIVNLHTKGAEADVLTLLKQQQVQRAIIHWYSGPHRIFEALLELGAYFTVGVEVLDSPRIERLARRIPEGRLLTETDNPGGLQWLRGSPGMPSVIQEVVRKLALLRGSTPDCILDTVRSNFLTLVGGDPNWYPFLPAFRGEDG